MNPVLRKLSSQTLSAGQLASLIQKHIGPGTSEEQCRQAVDALKRIRNPAIRAHVCVLSALLHGNFTDCEIALQVINSLRQWPPAIGATIAL